MEESVTTLAVALHRAFMKKGPVLDERQATYENWRRVAHYVLNNFRRQATNENPSDLHDGGKIEELAIRLHDAFMTEGHKYVLPHERGDPAYDGWCQVARDVIKNFSPVDRGPA